MSVTPRVFALKALPANVATSSNGQMWQAAPVELLIVLQLQRSFTANAYVKCVVPCDTTEALQQAMPTMHRLHAPHLDV